MKHDSIWVLWAGIVRIPYLLWFRPTALSKDRSVEDFDWKSKIGTALQPVCIAIGGLVAGVYFGAFSSVLEGKAQGPLFVIIGISVLALVALTWLENLVFALMAAAAGFTGALLIAYLPGSWGLLTQHLLLLLAVGYAGSIYLDGEFWWFGPGLMVLLSMAVGENFGALFGLGYGAACLAMYFRLPGYMLNTLWARICLLRLRADPTNAPNIWKRFPYYWDEMIWLPLPGGASFLRELVRYNREYGFEQIAFVAAERRLQLRAVRAALTEVALSDMWVAETADFANIPQRLRWISGAALLPPVIRLHSPIFVKVAEFMEQSRALLSHWRQVEALEGAMAELNGLRKRLIGVPGEAGPRMLQMANEWGRIIQGELKRHSHTATMKGEIPQVFRFGVPLGPDAQNVFVGRREIVAELEGMLLNDARPAAVFLYGPRRMGKSSILKQLPRLVGPRFAACMIDCQSPVVRENPARFFHGVARSLREALVRREITVVDLPLDALRAEPFSAFDDWLAEVERAMAGDCRAFVCFDEYEALDELIRAGWGLRLLDYLRHLQQHHPKFLFIFTGSHKPIELGREWNSRFISAKFCRVSFIPAVEFQPMLERPVPDFNLRYGPGVLDRLLALTKGQPFLTQAVAKELVDLMNDESRHEASMADVETAANRAIQSGEGYFTSLWDEVSPAERHALVALAGRAETVPGMLADRLRDMDVLDAEGRLMVPLFARWIRGSVTGSNLPSGPEASQTRPTN